MKFRDFILLMSTFIFVALIVFIYLPISHFPTPSGKYGVGQIKYHWTDMGRGESNLENQIHSYRELMVYVYYPTEKVDKASFCKYDKDNAKSLETLFGKITKLPKFLFAGLRFVKIHSVLNAPIIEGNNKFPIIIVSHGFGAMVQGWTYFLEELASHGYIVVGINHPYVAAITRYSDNQIIESLVFKKVEERKEEGGEESYKKWKEDQVEICSHDISFVINKIGEIISSRNEIWSNRADLSHVGVMGGSFGGSVATRACRKETRIKCGINMDGSLRGEDKNSLMNVPFMFLLAEKSNQWVGKGVKDLEDINKFCSNSKNIDRVIVKDIGHGVFSDLPILVNSTFFTRVLSNYFDFFSTSSFEKGNLPIACKQLGVIGFDVVQFFDKHLKNRVE